MSTEGTSTSSGPARAHLPTLARRLARPLALDDAALGAFVAGGVPALADAHAALRALAHHARRAGARSVDAALTPTALRVALGPSDTAPVAPVPVRTRALVEQAFGVPLVLESAEWVTIPSPDGRGPATEAAARLALEWLARIRSLEPEALADEDPEGVHQLRVAARRLREVLRALARATGDGPRVERLVSTTKSVARVGGTVRDLDVARALVAHVVGPARGRAAALERLDATRARRLVRMRAALTGAPHEARMARARATLEQLASSADQGTPRTAADVLRATTDRELERLCDQLGDDMTTREAFHAVRRRARRVRDAVELFGDALRKNQRAWRKRLQPVQSMLGALNDVDVTLGLLPSSPALDPSRAALDARKLELLATLATPLALLAVSLRFDRDA